ncbi:MAG: hypothetical protein JNJ63_08365 [Hyphomonadaceae bacterium]|nr:hypothetical protein [Hyphomonadaceae bacterium]
MNAAQALAIAAAGWVMAMDGPLMADLNQFRAQADVLSARLEMLADIQFARAAGGFRAVPDGGCIERDAALR